jgi:hypothetical protein
MENAEEKAPNFLSDSASSAGTVSTAVKTVGAIL